MSSVDFTFAALQAAAGSPLVSALLVLSIATILVCLLALLVSGTGYLVLLAWSSYERPAGSSSTATDKSRLTSYKYEGQRGFDESRLALVLAIQLAALWAALGAFASMLVNGSRKLVEFIISNPLLIATLILTFPLVVGWDTYHEIVLEQLGEVYNCFFAPIVRPLFLPIVNVYALFFGAVFPTSNAVREVVVGVSTTTAIRSVICAGSSLQALAAQLVSVFSAFGAALTVWLQQPNQGAFYVAPDFQQMGVELGQFVSDLQVFTECACQPLNEVAIAPFFEPFESVQFATAVNQTLNILPVFVSQGLVRPVLQSFINARDMPGAPFVDILSRPSLNSTFDTTTAAALSIGSTLDLFTVSFYDLIINTITAITSACPSLIGWTNTAPCRSDIVSGVCSSLQCITQSIVTVGCCRSALGFCTNNQTAATCTAPGSTFTAGSCVDVRSSCTGGSIPGCCLRDIDNSMSPLEIAGSCTDNVLPGDCIGVPGTVDHRGFMTCSEALASDPLLRCTTRDITALLLTEQRSCGSCAGADGDVCRCTDCTCEYQSGSLFGVNQCVAGTDPGTCLFDFTSISAPPVPGFFTGIAGLSDAVFLQPARLLFNAAFNIDIVFTTFDGYLYFDIQAVVDAAHSGIVNLVSPITWIADVLVELGDLAAATLSEPASGSLVVRGAPSVRALHASATELNEALGATGELLETALDALAALVRIPASFFVALFDFGFQLLQLFINLIVGTAWFTADTAVNGDGADPLAYARLLWGDDIPRSTTFDCLLTSDSAPNVKLFGMAFSDPSGTPCNLEMAALNYCRFVFQTAVAQNNTAPAAERDALDDPPSFLTISLVGAVPTLRSSSVACVGSAARCRAAVVANATLLVNVYELNGNNVVAIFTAFDPLVGAFCPECDSLQSVFTELAQPFVPFLLPLVDALVHVDKLFSTSYVKCLDLVSSAHAVEDFVLALTNILREVQPGLTPSDTDPCDLGATARDSRIFCVLAQLADAVVQLFTNVFVMLWNVAQAVVGIIDGSVSDTTVVVNSIDLVSFEVPVRTIAFDAVAIALQIIPVSTDCVPAGCCRIPVAMFPLAPQCIPQVFNETDCPDFADFFPDQICSTVPLCTSPGLGCCQTRNVLTTGTLNQARFCRDDVAQEQCDGVDQEYSPGTKCSTIGFPLVCPPSAQAQPVISDALGIVLSDVLLLFPRVAVGTVRELARVILAFAQDDPFSALIEAFFTPIFAVIGNTFDQLARILFCAGQAQASSDFFAIGEVVVDILDVGLKLLTDVILLAFYLVFGVIEFVTSGTTTILERAGTLLLDLLIFFAFAIFGDSAVCGLQDFLCDVCFFDGCDASVDFAVTQCRKIACCTLDVNVNNLCNVGNSNMMGEIVAPGCSCNTFTPNTCDMMMECGGSKRKRSTPFVHPFADIVRGELEQAKREAPSQLLPSAQFCGSYLAAIGIENARTAQQNDTVAADCLRVLELSTTEPTVAGAVRAYAAEVLGSAGVRASALMARASAHWGEMRDEAVEETEHRLAVARRDQAALRVDKMRQSNSLRAWLARERSYVPVNVRARSVEDTHELGEHISALMREHGAELSRSLIVQTMSVAMRINHLWISPAVLIQRTAERGRALSARATATLSVGAELSRKRIQLGLRLAIYHGGQYARRVSDGLGRIVGQWMPRFQRQAAASPLRSSSSALARSAPLEIDNDTLRLISLPECNATEQGLCTGCLVLDDAIRITQDAANGLAQFYPDNETGFVSYVDRFTEGIETTLINPLGNDTFTTVDKRVPWIGERFATVRWFWQWNYTQFLTIVAGSTNGTSSVPSNQTELLQQQRAAAAGREDFDVFFIEQFGAVVRPLLRIIESLVNVALDVGTEDSVLVKLLEVYVICDYQGALQCQSETLGVGLFDALVNVALIYLIIGTVLVSINVLFGISLFMLLLPAFYYLVLWVAYGASPLCTLPSFVLGIPGVPTCLPADVYTLVAETLQQCPVVPIALIEPSELGAASATLCTACGAVPAMRNCAEFGFLNGLDVFFYSAPSIFGDDFNARAASALAGVAPDIAAVAELYTADYIASLGDAGLVCNRIMLPSLLTAAGLVAARIAIVGALLLSLALLTASSFWLTWTVLLWNNEVVRQIDEGFVQQTRIEKLKVQ